MASETTDIDKTDAPGVVARVLASVGAPVLIVSDTIRDIFRVMGLTLYYLLHGTKGAKRRRAVVAQMHEIGNRSLVFVAVTLGFMGMILIFQAGFQANQITGDLQLLGALFLQLLLREFGPTITAMMIATRVGTGMAAQIGSMVVTEQVDALSMSGAQPVDYLVVPRFVASTIMMIVLTIFAVLVAYTAGCITAYSFFGLNPRTFIDVSMIGWFDINIGLIKALAYGMAIPITACQAGLSVVGGSEGVGRATTQAVVNASLAVVILDFLISGLGYVVLALL
jgi:phospholipid/cholesterol/gamma-HCH transport system permease protein